MPEMITSHQNPRVKQVRRLRDKSAREADGRFLIDTLRDLERALSCGYELDYLLAHPPQLRGTLPTLMDNSVFHVSKEVLERVAYRENPDGLVAVIKTPPMKRTAQLDQVPAEPILGLVSLTKPGNIGALLRTADAAGFRSVFLIDSRLDVYNPNIIRSSTGAVFLGNIYSLTAGEARTYFRDHDFRVICTHLAASSDAYAVEYLPKTVLLLGTEDAGLDDSWLEYCDQQVIIPMAGKLIDSLNVSVAGAVLMYEVLRQLRSRAE